MRCPGEYGFLSKPGHALNDHFDFLGFRSEMMFGSSKGYVATMDDQFFSAVGYYAGVRSMEEDSVEECPNE